MKKALFFLEAFFIGIIAVPIALLPLALARKSGEILGLCLFHVWGSRRRIALKNLKQSEASGSMILTESPEKTIRDNFRNFGKSFIEVVKVYFGFDKKILQHITLHGAEHFHAARSQGKGIIFITGHCGNWELLALCVGMRLSDIAVVARPIDNPVINNLLERVRKRYGNSVIYKKGALKSILYNLKNNGCVGILMDQAVRPNEGFIIDFLGRGAWTTKMPALIAQKTGAPVLPIFIHKSKEGHVVTIYPVVKLSLSSDKKDSTAENTTILSSYIEQYIKEYPSEWLWIHRRWKRTSQNKMS
jgi:KDO2-lipid IV(A) lauroyltransferase